MRTDLHNLMKQKSADAIWITGSTQHNPAMVYLTGIAHVTSADLFILEDGTKYLCHNPMEREEAAKSGFKLINYANYNFKDLLKEANGDYTLATSLRYKQILSEIGLMNGNVILYGMKDIGTFYEILKQMKNLLPDLNIMGDKDESILVEARATKDPQEIEKIRKMGKLTTKVVENTADMLSSHIVKNDILMKSDGYPLTIKDVKRQINLWIAELGGENPEDTIFSIGRDAGIPHSNGTPTQIIKTGQTIVFDIFPCEAGGGYFYDFTRTWCLGYAPDEVIHLYEQVLSVYNTITQGLKIGVNANYFQEWTCELFEEMGHKTIKSDASTTNGYVHSLGHGLGLNVHEKPWFSKPEDNSNILQTGSVFTIEPGLYYPERGMGVRLEDTYCVDQHETFQKLAEFPMDLILPVKGK